MQPIRIGIIGAGGIAGAYARAMEGNDNVRVVAIGSKEQGRADAFAAEFSLPKSYGSYQALVEDEDIDAVYNATPNGAHCEWTVKAAEAGKHILCEKPFALSVEEGGQMFRAAKEHKVVLLEGFPFRFQPQTLAALKRIRDGAIGRVVTVSAWFGFTLNDDRNVRMDPAQGGGAIWDVGSYTVNLVRAVFGTPPKEVSAGGKMRDGVDTFASMMLDYGDGRTASLWCSFDTFPARRATIVGTDGMVEFVFTNHTSTAEDSAFWIANAEGKSRIDNPCANGFVLESEAFADLIRGGGAPYEGTTERETMENTATLAAALQSLRMGGARVSI